MFWGFVFHISSRTDFIHGKPIKALVGALCHGYSLNCHVVYLATLGTPPLLVKKLNVFYLYATAKSEIHICSNKPETGLVFDTQSR